MMSSRLVENQTSAENEPNWHTAYSCDKLPYVVNVAVLFPNWQSKGHKQKARKVQSTESTQPSNYRFGRNCPHIHWQVEHRPGHTADYRESIPVLLLGEVIIWAKLSVHERKDNMTSSDHQWSDPIKSCKNHWEWVLTYDKISHN